MNKYKLPLLAKHESPDGLRHAIILARPYHHIRRRPAPLIGIAHRDARPNELQHFDLW